MFDLGKDKKKKIKDYAFDLEKDLKDPGKLRATQQQVEERIQTLKSNLRQGENKQLFDQMQILLQGYTAVQKVMQRVNRKM